jgi:adenylate cyclase
MGKVATAGAGEQPWGGKRFSVSGAAENKPRILVIEDEADIGYFLAALLESQYEVLTAGSGAVGLEMAASEPQPALILLDVMMPVMGGYAVMRRLASDARTADIPVIFLTALGSVADEQRGLDLGAIDYVTKPISPPILLARIRLHLQRSADTRRLKELSEQLSRYLAPQVYQSLFDGTRMAEIQTQRKQLTVFFSDIKNFTVSTALWQPEEVTLLLNSYFSEMSQIAAEYGATLDKFVGDAIVIFFGDPQTRGPREDALQCVRMAIAMQQRMHDLRQRWRRMGIGKTFEIRIGINTGFCDVGNFGSNLRMEYTIIGREVNLAARLEQLGQPGEILISSKTHSLVQGEIHTEMRESVLVKGFSEAIAVYAVTSDSLPAAGESGLIRCERPGVRVDIDVARLSADERAHTAAELRAAIERLEAPPPPAADHNTVQADKMDAAASGGGRTVTVAEPGLPDALAGLDIPLGLSRAMGMQALYLSMLQRYRDGRKDAPQQIRQALERGDLPAAELLSHSLLGLSAQIGATRVPDAAQALELAIHEQRPREEFEVLLLRMQEALDELIGALESGLPSATSRP